jgi:hypothetical protein
MAVGAVGGGKMANMAYISFLQEIRQDRSYFYYSSNSFSSRMPSFSYSPHFATRFRRAASEYFSEMGA